MPPVDLRRKIGPKRFIRELEIAFKRELKTQTRRVVTAANSSADDDFDFGDFQHARRDGRFLAVPGAARGPTLVWSKFGAGDIFWLRRGQRGGTRASSDVTLPILEVWPERLAFITDDDAIAEGISVFSELGGQRLGKYCYSPAQSAHDAILRRMKRAERQRYLSSQRHREIEAFGAVRPRDAFFALWEWINGVGSVESNPWVWVYRFKPQLVNIDKWLDRHAALVEGDR